MAVAAPAPATVKAEPREIRSTGKGTPAAERLRVLQGLHLGLPGYWYPILRSSELKGENHLVPVERFGIELVLWRDARGVPHAFEDRCPHRAARISVGNREPGKVRGQTLACWYHGWRWDDSGRCVDIPSQGVTEVSPERTQIRVFPVEEKAGFIWMFYGEGTPKPLDVPEELVDPVWYGYQTQVVWHTNWLNILDNLTDPLHQYVLHGTSYITQRRPPFNRVRIVSEDEERIHIVQYQQNPDGGVGAEETFGFEMRLPGRLRVELLNAAPGGNVRVLMCMTPIDEETTYVCYFRGRPVTGFKRLQWRLVWNLMYRRLVMRVQAQDEAMLCTMGPLQETRGREHLVESDAGVIRFRRMLNRAFERNRHAAPAPTVAPSA